MVGLVLFVQVPDAGDVGRVAFLLRPSDCLVLSFERREDAVGVVLDHIILDGAAFLAAFGPRLDAGRILFLQPISGINTYEPQSR